MTAEIAEHVDADPGARKMANPAAANNDAPAGEMWRAGVWALQKFFTGEANIVKIERELIKWIGTSRQDCLKSRL